MDMMEKEDMNGVVDKKRTWRFLDAMMRLHRWPRGSLNP